jgi:hypothetical protein
MFCSATSCRSPLIRALPGSIRCDALWFAVFFVLHLLAQPPCCSVCSTSYINWGDPFLLSYIRRDALLSNTSAHRSDVSPYSPNTSTGYIDRRPLSNYILSCTVSYIQLKLTYSDLVRDDVACCFAICDSRCSMFSFRHNTSCSSMDLSTFY